MNKENVQFVLVETSHPGNIGAAARAMKNMGLSKLVLVNPCEYKNNECYARAAGADELVDSASVHSDLESAVAESHLVIGTSARIRSLSWPQLSPRETAKTILGLSDGSGVSMVFGRERSGLTNDELALCSSLLVIPTEGEYSSLNVAAAVQVVAYEILTESLAGADHVTDGEPLAAQSELELFYDHLFEVMQQVGYLDPANPRLLIPRVRRLYNRSQLNRSELQLMRGFLSAVQKDQEK